MKTVLAFILSFSLLLTGCTTTVQKNAAAFFQTLPNINADDVTQTTTTPVFSHTEKVANLVTVPGSVAVSNVSADLAITPGGIQWYHTTFTASHVSISKVADTTTPPIGAAPVSGNVTIVPLAATK